MAMEEIFVSGTSQLLKKLVSVVEDFLANGGTDPQLNILKKTLENIDAVTCDAEMKQVNDPEVKRWLIKLKELAYDADDDLDRFFYEAVVMCGFKRKSTTTEIINPLAGLPISLNSDIIHELDRLSSDRSKFGLQQISNTPSQSSRKQKILTSDSRQGEEYMKFRYYGLSSHLKQCFSYFSLFPEDWRFDRESLIQMWIAEGFLDQPSNEGFLDVGNEYFNHVLSCLVLQNAENEPRKNFDMSCSLIQNVEKDELGDIIAFKLHHYVYDFAQSVAGRHEVTVLSASAMEISRASEIRRLLLVLDEGKPDISTILLLGRKLRTVFFDCNSFWRLKIDSLHLRVIRLVDASQLSIFSAKHLRYLHLTDCEIIEIDMDNCKFQLLQTLHLSNCRNVHMVLKQIQSMEMLRHFTLYCSEVKVLPESIFTLLNLQTLNISGCDINVLPVSVGFLQNLLSLDISHTPITELPDSVTSIYSLRRLEFHHCHSLRALPSNLGALTQLRSLNLESSGITELPDSICRIYSLEKLQLGDCSELDALPNDLGTLTQLRSLNLEGSGIRELPESLSSNLWKIQFVNIKGLRVFMPYRVRKMEEQKNALPVLLNKQFSGIQGLAGLNSLSVLEITHLENVKGNIDARSAQLHIKQQLRELSLKWEGEEADDDNDSVMVLEGLQPTSNLKKLVIENFGGVKLPQWMGSWSMYCLPNLVELYLSDCHRCEKLHALGMLPSLKVLWIYGMRSMKCLGQEFYYQDESTSSSAKAEPATILFPSLTMLELGDMDNLEEWVAPPPSPNYTSFPVLETLCIIGCCELTSIPDFRSCTSLRELTVEECDKLNKAYYDFIRKNEQSDDSSEEYQSPTSITTVRYLVKEITSGTHESSGIQDIAALDTEKLHIRNLENVRGGKEGAERAKLKDKQNIEDLYLSWSSSSSNNDDEFIDRSVNDGMVLEGLQPHPNLKMLTIAGFRGLNLPKWIGSSYLPHLVDLHFYECNTCEKLPALGMLPCLKNLKIEGMNSVQCLGKEFYDRHEESSGSSSYREINEEEINTEVFPSLEELSLIDMPILEEWAAPRHSLNSIPSLKKLIVSCCSMLKSIPLSSFSSLQSLELYNTNDEVVTSILASKGGERHTCLQSVSVKYSPQLKYFPVWLLPNQTRIQSLEIAHCSNFKGFRILDNDEFQAQVSLDTRFNTCISNFCLLKLFDCLNILSSDNGFNASISSLCSLKLFDCPALTSLPDLRECNSLTKLWIEDCDKLKDSFSYSLASLPGLETLYVDRLINLHRE